MRSASAVAWWPITNRARNPFPASLRLQRGASIWARNERGADIARSDDALPPDRCLRGARSCEGLPGTPGHQCAGRVDFCTARAKEKGLRKEGPLSAPKGAADTPDEPEAASNKQHIGAKGHKIKVRATSKPIPTTPPS